MVQISCGNDGKKNVGRLIQRPVCGKKVVASKSARAVDYVKPRRLALRLERRRALAGCGGSLKSYIARLSSLE
jgi:hypothetical protein